MVSTRSGRVRLFLLALIAWLAMLGATTPGSAQALVGEDLSESVDEEGLPSSIPDPNYRPPEPTGKIISSPQMETGVWVPPYEAFVSARQPYGFDVSRVAYEKLASSDHSNWVDGIPASAEEKAQIERWQAQHDASNEVVAALRVLPDYAGSALDDDGSPGSLRIFGTPEFTRAVRGDLSKGGLLDTTIEEVRYSLQELEAQKAAVTELRLDDGLGVVAAGIDYTTNSVTAKILTEDAGGEGVAGARIDAARDTIRDVAPAVREVSLVDSISDSFSLCHQAYCKPIGAGYYTGVDYPHGNFDAFDPFCTQGFVLERMSDGNLYGSTAAHCNGPGLNMTMGPDVLGSVAYWSFTPGGDADLLAFDVADTIATNDRSDFSGTGLPITGNETQNELQQNEWHCHIGLSTSGCSQVINPSSSLCRAVTFGWCTHWQHDAVQSMWVGQGGDSGGGVYMLFSPKDAVGFVAAGWEGDGYLTSVDNINSLIGGMRLYTDDRPERDWIIPLYLHGLIRHPDTGGLNYWTNYLETSCTLSRIRDVYYNLLISAESLNIGDWFDAGWINGNIDRAFKSGLGRLPDAGERQNWFDWIDQGNLSYRQSHFADLVYTITFSTEFSGRVLNGSQGDRATCWQ